MAKKSLNIAAAFMLAINIFAAFAAVPTTSNVSVETKATTAILIDLFATRGDAADTLRFTIDTFPANGKLYQVPSGWEVGNLIESSSALLEWIAASGDRTKVWYEPNTGFSNQIDSLTFKVDDGSSNNAATGVVSVSVFESCPNLFQSELQWGQQSGAPNPTVDIQYDSNTQEFKFDVTAAYARNATWVINFSEFNINSNQVGAATNCENRASADFGGAFSTFWKSAPVATFSGALGGSTYLTYPSANIWTLASNGCDKVKYTTTRSFSELLSCKTHSGASAITSTQVSSTPFTDYTGTLFVQLVRPVDSTNAATTYQKLVWAYPFNFRFNMITNVLTTAASAKDVAVSVVSLTLNSNGNLLVKLRTEIATGYLTNPIVPTAAYALNVNSASANQNSVQEWEYVSAQVQATNYNGQYRFEWTFSTGGQAVAIINLEMKAQTLVNQAFSLNTQLATFKDLAFSQSASGPFGSGARIYVKDSLNADSTDANNFVLSVTNAWLCYSDNADFIPTYNPSSGRYGCTQPIAGVMGANNIVKLIDQNSPLTTGLQQYFGVQLHTLATTYTTGFSFLAQPLSLEPRVYYIHAETLITQKNGNKRTSVMIARADQQQGTGNALNSVYMEGGQLPGAETATPEEEASVAVMAVASPLAMLVFLAVLLM